MAVSTPATEDLDAVPSYQHFIVFAPPALPSLVFATLLLDWASIATAPGSPERTSACPQVSQSTFSLSRLEVVMKKFFSCSLLMLALVGGAILPVLADTIRLKDGSVIRGQIVSFKNEQFTIMVGSGARGRKSRITVYMEDVDSIEFDAAGNAGNSASPSDDSTTGNTQPSYQPPPSSQPTNNQPTNNAPSNTPPGNTQPAAGNPAAPTFFQVNTRVRADNASNGWTNTGLVVRRGQRLRITASGRVSLGKDPNTGRETLSTPDGWPNRTDKQKLMSKEPTGGLIAVIGDDNDDFIFIGRSHDFVAQRDGVLFLGVNEGNLSDNSGVFEVVIEAEAANPR